MKILSSLPSLPPYQKKVIIDVVKLVSLTSFIIGILGVSGVETLKEWGPAACYSMIFIPVAFWMIQALVKKNRKIEGFISLDKHKIILDFSCLNLQSKVYIPESGNQTNMVPCSLQDLMINLESRHKYHGCYKFEVASPDSATTTKTFFLIYHGDRYFEISGSLSHNNLLRAHIDSQGILFTKSDG